MTCTQVKEKVYELGLRTIFIKRGKRGLCHTPKIHRWLGYVIVL